MDNSRIVFLLNDTVRAIKAQYEDGGAVEVFKTFDGTLAVDDLVTVQSSTRHGVTVVKVKEINHQIDFDAATPIKWVVQKIDMKAFAKIIAQEAEAITAVQQAEMARRKDELRRTMVQNHESTILSLPIANHDDGNVVQPPSRPE